MFLSRRASLALLASLAVAGCNAGDSGEGATSTSNGTGTGQGMGPGQMGVGGGAGAGGGFGVAGSLTCDLSGCVPTGQAGAGGVAGSTAGNAGTGGTTAGKAGTGGSVTAGTGGSTAAGKGGTAGSSAGKAGTGGSTIAGNGGSVTAGVAGVAGAGVAGLGGSDAGTGGTQTTTCTLPEVDCSGACVDLDLSMDNCGACGKVCDPQGTSVAACKGGICNITCSPMFKNCNADPYDGCEVSIYDDPANCGDCNTVCTFANATVGCTAGSCTHVCSGGFEDCDMDGSNGCEIELTADPGNCGGCGIICSTAGTLGTSCQGGFCAPVCDATHADCDMDPTNGCEADLTQPASCGMCGLACVSGSSCIAGACETPKDLAVGDGVACIVTKNDQAICWGRDDVGQCGRGSISMVTATGGKAARFDRAPTNLGFAPLHVSLTEDTVFAWRVDGTSMAEWGGNSRSVFGFSSAFSATPLGNPTWLPSLMTGHAAGYDQACGVLAGASKCWGWQEFGQLGNGQNLMNTVGWGNAFVTGGSPKAFGFGKGVTCVHNAAGDVFCAGRNDLGQMANGGSGGPIVTPTLLTNVDQLAVGATHACALQSGVVLCWGDNGWGATGNPGGAICSGGSPCHTSPLPVNGLPPIVEISASADVTCARDFGGLVFCWGRADALQTGPVQKDVCANGFCNLTPTALPMPPATMVRAGTMSSCAIARDGGVYCWGDNKYGNAGPSNVVTFGQQNPPTLSYP